MAGPLRVGRPGGDERRSRDLLLHGTGPQWCVLGFHVNSKQGTVFLARRSTQAHVAQPSSSMCTGACKFVRALPRVVQGPAAFLKEPTPAGRWPSGERLVLLQAEPPKQLDDSVGKTGCAAIMEELLIVAPWAQRRGGGNENIGARWAERETIPAQRYPQLIWAQLLRSNLRHRGACKQVLQDSRV